MEDKRYILVVDCDEDIATETARFLSNICDEEIIIAYDGRSAYDKVCTYRPSIVIMDLILYDLDGFELMRRIKDINPDTFIVVVSYIKTPKIIKTACDNGADYYMLKPTNKSNLYKRLVMFCDLHTNVPYYNSGVEELTAGSEQRATINIEEVITKILIDEMGVNAKTKGYRYLKEAIYVAIANPKSLDLVTKSLYPDIAQKLGGTASCVERAMRHTIVSTWANRPDWLDIPGLSKSKPTNSQFISAVAEKIKMRYHIK